MPAKRILKYSGLLMLFFTILMTTAFGSVKVKAAASPKFKYNSIELKRIGAVSYLEILNKVDNSKYKWSSSNENVATVSSSGLVRAVGLGTAKIKCIITYESGKTKTLTCNVTVRIPASEIKIDNAKLTNGAHVMMVGESYTFKSVVTPSNTSDKVYWSLDASDPDANINAVRIDDPLKGKVTALRRGKIVLVATAVKEATAKDAEKSLVNDSIIIEVVGPSAEVVSAKIINSKTLRVVFGTTIRKSTVVKADGRLSDNIKIEQLLDSSGKKAADPGTLTAILSNDQKTLTITAGKSFNGYYGISFSSSILTTEGQTIYRDYFNVSYIDNSVTDESNEEAPASDDTDTAQTTEKDVTAPTLAGVSVDDDGMTNIITFSEKMDFSRFQVSNARQASSSGGVSPTTISYLNGEWNYNISADGKSLIINLSYINSEDYNKGFLVTISGVTDEAGNAIKDGSVDVLLLTNTAPMPQAMPKSIVRTSYDTLTATFSRAIRVPGYLSISNGGFYVGKVNPDNNKQVIFTISDYDATLTGMQNVSIGFWDSYNVRSDDKSAQKYYDYSVNFTVEKGRPVLTSYKFSNDHRILTLTYSEPVRLYSKYGSLDYTMTSYKYSDLKGYLEYSIISIVDNVVELALKNMTLYGNYSFTLPEGFVLDNYRNLSFSSPITLYNVSGESGANKLAEPYSIYQSHVNNSIIYIEFADRLDEASALDADNYRISTGEIEDIKLIKNNTDGATIQITMVKGSISANGKYNIRISGIKGFNGSYTEMDEYTGEINLVENTDPQLKSVVYDPNLKDTIKLVFTENIQGNIIVSLQERDTGYTIGNNVTVSGDTVTITMDFVPADGTHVIIYVLDNRITDLNDNESIINPVLYAFVNY